ncbi:RNA methyltransferase, partial [Listeria monocytogenes]
GGRHITVSKSGLAPRIIDCANEDSQVNLAISLHAPNNERRTSIMLITKPFSIEKLREAIHYSVNKTNRRITFEYIMLKGVNDHNKEALELAALLGAHCHLAYVNLIPYNPEDEHIDYERRTQEDLL